MSCTVAKPCASLSALLPLMLLSLFAKNFENVLLLTFRTSKFLSVTVLPKSVPQYLENNFSSWS